MAVVYCKLIGSATKYHSLALFSIISSESSHYRDAPTTRGKVAAKVSIIGTGFVLCAADSDSVLCSAFSSLLRLALLRSDVESPFSSAGSALDDDVDVLVAVVVDAVLLILDVPFTVVSLNCKLRDRLVMLKRDVRDFGHTAGLKALGYLSVMGSCVVLIWNFIPLLL